MSDMVTLVRRELLPVPWEFIPRERYLIRRIEFTAPIHDVRFCSELLCDTVLGQLLSDDASSSDQNSSLSSRSPDRDSAWPQASGKHGSWSGQPRQGVEPLEFTAFPGVVSDFINELLIIEPGNSSETHRDPEDH